MQESHLTISVIIPAYNVADCLRRAVESALTQTYAPAQILLIEDHSTDDTLRVAQELAAEHAQIKVYALSSEGVSAARNEGLRRATGELITFLDADDAMAPTMLEELVRLMQETNADIAGCDFRDGDGSVTVYQGSEIICKAILTDHDTRVWSKLYKRAAIDTVTYPEDMTIGEDMLFLLTTAARRNLTYALVRKNLYRYTINPVGAMERPFTLTYMDQIRCWDRAEEILRQHDAEIPDHAQRQEQPMVPLSEQEPEQPQTEIASLLTPDTFARLRAIQTVSAILVARKIARVPSAERAQYTAQWTTARASLRHYRTNRDSRRYYPPGYALKAFLLANLPGLFQALFGR